MGMKEIEQETWLIHLGEARQFVKFPDGTDAEIYGWTTDAQLRTRLISHAPHMLRMLRALEFSEPSAHVLDDEDMTYVCPHCKRSESEGHSEDCEFTTLFRDLGIRSG